MPEESQTKPRPARDPQALTSEYHKARKQLMLWAGILFIWELVGIDLEKAKEAGGNAGAILTAIKSPQAIPWVLVVLVAYFVFKLGVEWNQCEARRRETRASRIDVGSAWVVAFLACALYAYQAISQIQVADVVQSSDKLKSSVLGMMVGLALSMALILVFHKGKKSKQTYVSPVIFAAGSSLMLVYLLYRGELNVKYVIGTALIAGAAMGLLYYFLVRRFEVSDGWN